MENQIDDAKLTRKTVNAKAADTAAESMPTRDLEEDLYKLLRINLPNAKLSCPERGLNSWVNVDREERRS